MCGNNFTMLWSSFVLYRDVNGSGSAWNQAHRKFAGPEFGPTENFCTEKFYNVIFQASKGTKISNFRGLRPSNPLRGGGGAIAPSKPPAAFSLASLGHLYASLRSAQKTPRFASLGHKKIQAHRKTSVYIPDYTCQYHPWPMTKREVPLGGESTLWYCLPSLVDLKEYS